MFCDLVSSSDYVGALSFHSYSQNQKMLGLVVDFFYCSESQYSNFLEKYECLNLGTHKLCLNSYFESILVLHWIKIME